jgi:hypothetical protein
MVQNYVFVFLTSPLAKFVPLHEIVQMNADAPIAALSRSTDRPNRMANPVQNRTKKNSLAGPHGTTRKWTKDENHISKIIVNQEEQPQPTKMNRKGRFRAARKQRKRARVSTNGTTEARVSTNGTKATQSEPFNKKLRKN